MADQPVPAPVLHRIPLAVNEAALENGELHRLEKPSHSHPPPPPSSRIQSLESCPPYQKLAETLMGPVPEMAIMRKFGDLNMLNLMTLQAELIHFRERLLALGKASDRRMTNADIPKSLAQLLDPKNGCRREGAVMHPKLSEQMTLLLKMREKLEEYNKALLQVYQINALPKPDKSNSDQLRNWISKARKKDLSLNAPEYFTWASENEDDLVTLAKESDRDQFSKFFSGWVVRKYHALFGRHRKNRDWVDEEFGVARYSDRKMERVSVAFASVVASVLPVLAILILYVVKDTTNRIYITIAMTFVFALALAMFTSAKHHEIFAATSAFAAVEVVFIGSVQGS
ncbi:hypothetical protein K431DRAFT_347565 [Polychaeton citri CBS 116435]|uniref:DUF6594 domain-containing protein n=1 Tax=Polychaeton citri CBS 116435 TaxID=1314669 RepID=A0A9P4UNM4_9PEZI|nr:hypothetical protein K431DRAFT_347565 [Polychaeton citri CBS 116435]